MSLWEELSFLAPPDEAQDWRMVVLCNAAAQAGVLAALPATPAELAGRLGLDEHAVGVVLEALAAWSVVRATAGEVWVLGPRAPSADATAVLGHHARALGLWSSNLDDRLHGRSSPQARPTPQKVAQMLEALTINGRESAPGTVDACLARVPGATQALDLGGGHGEYALELTRRGLAVTVQDQDHVIEAAREAGRLEQAGIDLFAGDFFEVLPEGPFDLVLCAGVTYTFDAARNVELYRRVRSILAPGGVLAVHTFLRGTDPRAALFAVQMLSGGRGGDTHSEEEHRRWLGDAGYDSVEVVTLARRPESLVFAQGPPGPQSESAAIIDSSRKPR